MPAIQILPSLLAADFGRLAEDIRRVEAAGADGLHLDIMDGNFVRNISFGPDLVKTARRHTGLYFSVHLMLAHPEHYLSVFREAGADLILIHAEARCDVPATLRAIRATGARAGVTLNPETPADLIDPLLAEGLVDEVLCMSVHPGFGGQAFIEHVLPKIAGMRRSWPDLDLSVDGGMDVQTVPRCAAAGINVFIAGTSLFRAPDMAADIRRMRDGAQAAFATRTDGA